MPAELPIFNFLPAPLPERTTLTGRFARLEPLSSATHAAALWPHVQVTSLWDYLSDEPFPSEAAFTARVTALAGSADPLLYCIVDLRDGAPSGWASLMRIEPKHRSIEVGYILYTPRLQRTPAATEAMYLLARYIFETLGYRRYEWKCNALNRPSRRAAERLGFVFEGLFRQHQIVKGKNRDTAWFSMLDREWPQRKQRFERWLDPSNFDEAGVQRHALSEFPL